MKKIFAVIYWFFSLTWGLIMTIPGLIGTLVLIFLGGTTHRNGCSIITEIKDTNWGGLSLGPFSFCSRYSEDSPSTFDEIRKHEFGHSLQNIILGPLFIFVIGIPSFVRYWYSEYKDAMYEPLDDDWYESAWFEHTATKYGTKIVDWLE